MVRFEDMPPMLTVQMLAQITGEHEDTIRRGIKKGNITADKVNGKWLISRDAVFANTAAFVAQRADGEAVPCA